MQTLFSLWKNAWWNKRQAKARVVIGNKATLDSYLLNWHTLDKNLAPKSTHIRKIAMDRLKPYIGDIKLLDLRAPDIQNTYDQIL